MATVKSYTDIKQSKKLVELLPLETADMIWVLENPDLPAIKAIPYEDSDYNNKYLNIIPAWSLTALLNIIPKHIKDYTVLRIDISENEFSIWYDEVRFGVNKDLPDITVNTPVDACYELVLKLHELNLL